MAQASSNKPSSEDFLNAQEDSINPDSPWNCLTKSTFLQYFLHPESPLPMHAPAPPDRTTLMSSKLKNLWIMWTIGSGSCGVAGCATDPLQMVVCQPPARMEFSNSEPRNTSPLVGNAESNNTGM
ncbi:unnamed protein product [Notodromas monacha]|uniref:Uncharacterized protein n=1 Tax=Notodromas monacha TaxID=399045 RepID=A0A7R9GHC2_9CRUS|nr:unnamed protein product [Notodromas monacha]CAG0922732.1 unnamed protein product [Notodromas monacha]